MGKTAKGKRGSIDRAKAQPDLAAQARARVLDPSIDIWQRQPKENDRQWLAFQAFKALQPPRYLKTLVEEHGKTLGAEATLSGWSHKWKWRERCEAWDRHVANLADQAHIDEITKMRRRHASAGLLMMTIGSQHLDLVRRSSTEKLSVADARTLIVEGSKLEARSRGVPDSHAQHDHRFRDVELDSLDDHQLQRLAAGEPVDKILADAEKDK